MNEQSEQGLGRRSISCSLVNSADCPDSDTSVEKLDDMVRSLIYNELKAIDNIRHGKYPYDSEKEMSLDMQKVYGETCRKMSESIKKMKKDKG